jgi:hypothetical protein
MPRKRFVLMSVLGALLAAVTVLAPTGPATAASSGRLGPGTQLVTAGHLCAANFVFRDARHRVFLGYAASCATRTGAGSADVTCARSLPLGTRVRLADRGRTVGHGVLRYSSFRTLHRAGLADAATCAANDFALVEVRGDLRRRVSPSVPYWGGPTGLGALPGATAYVFGLARPTAGARTLPRAGQVTSAGASTASVTTLLPSTGAARGSGFLDGAGRAVGVLTRSTLTGDNTVVSLATAVGFARGHGVPGLRVVRGGAFSGAAVL